MITHQSRISPVFRWIWKNNELLCWIAALAVLFFCDLGDPENSLCIFRFAGLDHCPGCGIGHAIQHALHLNFAQSFSSHFMGIPAVLIIAHRIIQLTFTKKQQLT